MAGGTVPVHLVVDISGLEALRDRLKTLRRDLDDATRIDLYADVSETGDVDVSDAIDRFIAGWRDGRQRIGEKLDRCLSLLDLAISTYRESESTLTTAANGTAAP